MQPWREEISLASIAIKYCFSARYRLSVFQYLPQHRGNRIQYDFIFIFAVLRTETFYILVCCMSKHIGKNCVISYRSSFSIENYWKMFLKTFFPFARLFCIFFIHERSFYWITFAATITKSQSLNWNCFERKWFWIHTSTHHTRLMAVESEWFLWAHSLNVLAISKSCLIQSNLFIIENRCF